MDHLSQRESECIKSIQINSPSVVDNLRGLDLNTQTAPLYILVNFRNWDGLHYALNNTNRFDVLIDAAATTEWLEAVDLVLPYASPDEILHAAIRSARNNKLESVKRLAPHCKSLRECVIPACFSQSALPVLHFLLERGEAQYVRDHFKDTSRENDPYMMSVIEGEKFWRALDFLREHTTRWELDRVTHNHGSNPPSKKM